MVEDRPSLVSDETPELHSPQQQHVTLEGFVDQLTSRADELKGAGRIDAATAVLAGALAISLDMFRTSVTPSTPPAPDTTIWL